MTKQGSLPAGRLRRVALWRRGAAGQALRMLRSTSHARRLAAPRRTLLYASTSLPSAQTARAPLNGVAQGGWPAAPRRGGATRATKTTSRPWRRLRSNTERLQVRIKPGGSSSLSAALGFWPQTGGQKRGSKRLNSDRPLRCVYRREVEGRRSRRCARFEVDGRGACLSGYRAGRQ